jgi:sugar phosphate isomerase/epimerase
VCFPGAGWSELAGYWRDLGARRVSVASNLLLENGSRAARDTLQACNCVIETITHPFLSDQHLDQTEDSWRAARGTLDAGSIYMLTGGHGSLTWEEAAGAFSEAIAPCVAQAKAAGVPLLVENSSPLYAHAHIAHTLRDTVTLAQAAGIGVCMDLFACWAEAGLRESIEQAMPACHVVQVCDYVYGDRALPARAVPGDGAIPVKRILEWVLQAGYTGAFDIELIGPRIDAEGRLAAVRRTAANVGEMLIALGA